MPERTKLYVSVVSLLTTLLLTFVLSACGDSSTPTALPAATVSNDSAIATAVAATVAAGSTTKVASAPQATTAPAAQNKPTATAAPVPTVTSAPKPTATTAPKPTATAAPKLTATAAPPQTDPEAKALDILVKRLKQDKVGGSNFNCLGFLTENVTADYVEISVHSKNGGACGGDPNVFPRLAQYRVYPATSKILQLDILNDVYVPYPIVVKP